MVGGMLAINITTTPIKYEYQLSHAKLETKQEQNLVAGLNFSRSNLEMHSKRTEVRIDTSDAFASIGLRGTGAWAQWTRDNGRQAAFNAIGDAAQLGNSLANIADGVTVGDVARSRLSMGSDGITTTQVFIPATGPQLDWTQPEISTKYTPGEVEHEWQLQKNVVEYIPGKFSILISQFPGVDIEYVGGFLYVPPSANPEL